MFYLLLDKVAVKSFSDCFIGFMIVKTIAVTHSIRIVVDLSMNALIKAEIF